MAQTATAGVESPATVSPSYTPRVSVVIPALNQQLESRE